MVVRGHNVGAGSANAKGSHVLHPHLRRIYRLEDLVKRMTLHNVQTIDFGGPVVQEML